MEFLMNINFNNNEFEQIEKPKNKNINIISIILILVIFMGLTLYMINVDGLDNIKTLLKSVDYGWVLARSWNFNFMVDM